MLYYTIKNRIEKELVRFTQNIDKLYNLSSISPLLFKCIKDFILSNNDIDNVNEYFVEDELDDYLEEDLWGGVCEQYALAKRFNINVITFIPTRHSFSREDKKYHIEVSKIVTKTTRYKLSSCCFRNSHLEKNLQQLRIGFQDFDKTEINNTVFLLLFIRDSSHYNHLYLK